MKKIIKQLFILTTVSLILSSCSTFFDKDNTPLPAQLVKFKPELTVRNTWYSSRGAGVDSDYLKLSPAISGANIYTASRNGTVAANDKTTGKSLWRAYTKLAITGGTSVANNAVYVGTSDGRVVALSQTDGTVLWTAITTSEILASPVASRDVVLAKSIDGHIRAFSATDGHVLWNYQADADPSLILRGDSTPQVTSDSAVVGFENGSLIKLSLKSGRQQWQTAVAEPQGIFAIQRMIDIDADPVIVGNRIYAVTYQGQIAALQLSNGQEIWSHKMSSFSGIASDGDQVFVTDAKSHLYAFNSRNGNIAWQQDDLYARVITGPAVIGNYVVVGDAEGYLHWMDKHDGHFVARTFVNKSGIIATPLVDHNSLYVYTKDGHLAAYTFV